MSTPTGVSRTETRHDIDWSAVDGAVRWTPPQHRQGVLDEDTAMRWLRCTPASFAALRAHGLEPADTPDGPRYDGNDVRNAGLYSRSGHTEVEQALGAILSFLRGSPEEVFGPCAWAWELTALADDGQPCRLHAPSPEVFGGTTVTGPSAGHDGRVAAVAGVAVRGELITRGTPDPVLDPEIHAVTRDVLGSGVRWHHLADGLKRDPEAAYRAGVGNCDTLSAVLADRLVAAGRPAEVLRGWIVGMTTVPHSWVEVRDADGRAKVVDPSLLLLARHSLLGSPEFERLAFGAAPSRIVPTRCTLAESVAVTEGGRPCPVRFVCRRRPLPPTSQSRP